MKIKLHVITSVCVRAGRVREVGHIEHSVVEVNGDERPECFFTKKHDDMWGTHRELIRTELEIDAPEIDGKELVELQIQSLIAEKSDLEANFYVAKRKIEDRISSLQAIEHK